MALNKAEVTRAIIQARTERFKYIETEIDNILSGYNGEPIYIDLDKCGGHKFLNMVQDTYEATGWTVELISDQRDGDCIKFS